MRIPKPLGLASLLAGCVLAASSALAASNQQADATQDWPAVINQLRQQLDQFPNQVQVRQQLAVAYNNYAVNLANRGELSEAAKQLEEAIRVDPSNSQLKDNLAIMHVQEAQDAYQAHQTQRAREAIQEALSAKADTAEAYALLGEIEYNSQRLKEAKTAWQEALKLKPDYEQVKQRLAQVTQELPVESDFAHVSQIYFDVRFPDTLDRTAGFDLQERLLAARRSVGTDFSYWPNHKIIVLVYSAQQFRQLRQNAPEWAGGQYDGKIRVPLPNGELNPDAVSRILTHEYTHAVIFDLTNNGCPVWLNEGLAEYEAWKDTTPAWQFLRHALSQGRPIPWAQLFTAGFSGGMSTQDASLAYEQAHSIVRFLVQRFGFWRIKRLLQAAKQGTPMDQAMETEFHLKLARLEDGWREWLHDTLR